MLEPSYDISTFIGLPKVLKNAMVYDTPLKLSKVGIMLLLHQSSTVFIVTVNSSLDDGGFSDILKNRTWTRHPGHVEMRHGINSTNLTQIWSRCYVVKHSSRLYLPEMTKSFYGTIFIKGKQNEDNIKFHYTRL